MDSTLQEMRCMEVWGGNIPVDAGVVMTGLDAWVYCRPHAGAEAGGDVYYVSSCATGRIARLLVADVSGHGSAVAQTATTLRRLMRRCINHLDQTRLVSSMNSEFAQCSENGCFATALVSTFFAPTNELSLSNAGHPPPLLYQADRRRWGTLASSSQIIDAEAKNFPLGVETQGHYGRYDLRLNVGDLVLCYTDALIEARDPSGQFLGSEGLLDLVRSIPVDPPADFISQLLSRVEQFTGGRLDDDLTVLLFRPNGVVPPVPLGRRLLAPCRVAWSAVRVLFPHGGPAAFPDLRLANIGGAMFGALNRFTRKQSGRCRGLFGE